MARKNHRKALETEASFAERVARLSAKRQEIVRPIVEQPRDYVLLSVRALAKRLKTDPATMVRIVRGLGFPSYREFQRYLHDLSIAYATSLDTMRTSAVRDSSIPGYIREALDHDQKNLQALKNSLDSRRLVAVARRLYSAKHILVLAGDLAASLATFLEYEASILGLPIVCGTSAGRVAHLVRTIGKGDVVLAISFRRGLRQTVEGVQQARTHGAYCIGITDTYISPLARFCDEVFLASVETTSFGASYVAPMALLNALLVACANYKRARTLTLLKLADEEQRKGYRWYPS
jgi:RpiR family carbohydrate utilization transcriptional regulator